MNTSLIVEEAVIMLRNRYGKSVQLGRSGRLWNFGKRISCSVNYSKLLRGEKFFFGLSQEAADKCFAYPPTDLGDFVVLICGSAQEVLVLPRLLVLQMLEEVPTRKLDVFREAGSYILQTTKHPKLDVTEYLNAFPKDYPVPEDSGPADQSTVKTDRAHVKFQSALIDLGRAEGCSVWVPPGDRGLSVFNQLIRPSFHTLIAYCGFCAFEEIDGQLKKIESMRDDKNVRITGLIKGERFTLPDAYVYPAEV